MKHATSASKIYATGCLLLSSLLTLSLSWTNPVQAEAWPLRIKWPSLTAKTSGCPITKDDGTKFTDMSVSSCGDYYPPAHLCAQQNKNPLCDLQNRIKGVDRDGIDMIVNAHRGVWGLSLNDPHAATNPRFDISKVRIGGAAENSLDGLLAAYGSGFQTVEFDVFMVRDDKTGEKTPEGMVYVTHFTDYRGFTDYSEEQAIPQNGIDGAKGFLMATPAKDISKASFLHLRDRNGAVTKSTLMPLETFMSQASTLGMLVVLDVKFAKELAQYWQVAGPDGEVSYQNRTIGFQNAYPKPERTPVASCATHKVVPGSYEDQTLRTISAINKTLKDPTGSRRTDYRFGVVIKFPQSAIPCPSLLKATLGSDFEKLLFAPNPDLERKVVDIAYVTDYVDEWMRVGPKSIAFWDTSISSVTHWQGHEFQAKGRDGQTHTYKDLMDFLLRETGRRSAIWNIDPSGPGGRHGNFGMAWEHKPNDATDERGDQHANLVFSGAKHALVTTDRPDIYLVLRQKLKELATLEAGQ